MFNFAIRNPKLTLAMFVFSIVGWFGFSLCIVAGAF